MTERDAGVGLFGRTGRHALLKVLDPARAALVLPRDQVWVLDLHRREGLDRRQEVGVRDLAREELVCGDRFGQISGPFPPAVTSRPLLSALTAAIECDPGRSCGGKSARR